MTVAAAIQRIGHKTGAATNTEAFDAKGNRVVLSQYAWPNTIYCIYYVMPQSVSGNHYQSTFRSVEVFRLSTRPPDYQGKYVQDFLKFISGDRTHNPGFQYELIYSDPPAKPKAK